VIVTVIREGERGFHGSIIAFQALRKRFQIRNATLQALLQPSVQLISVPFPYHREELLSEVIGNINSLFLANESKCLKLLLVEMLWLTYKQPCEVARRA